MNGDVIGIRLTRNAPVIFIDRNGLTFSPGDAVVVELGDVDEELEASVVIGACQLLHASVARLVGRALRVG